MDNRLRKIKESIERRERREQKKLEEKVAFFNYQREEYLTLFGQYRWEWFCTFTYKHTLSANYAFSLLSRWNEKLKEVTP